MNAYGKLCSIFYDATKKFAPEREVNFYAQFINQNPGRVLEAMSGSGRLLIPLLERGYVVDGMDNSPVMLGRCRERCAQFGYEPELYEQSLEELSLPHRYTTVTIAVGSFQLIADRAIAKQALARIRAHMEVGGNLLIDTFTPNTQDTEPSVRVVHLDDGRAIRLTTRYIYDVPGRIADAFCAYELLVQGAVREREDELIRVTWYSDDELTLLLEAAGFFVERFYDETLRSAGPSHIVHARAV